LEHLHQKKSLIDNRKRMEKEKQELRDYINEDNQNLKNQLENESKRMEAENQRRAKEAEEMRQKLEREKIELARRFLFHQHFMSSFFRAKVLFFGKIKLAKKLLVKCC